MPTAYILISFQQTAHWSSEHSLNTLCRSDLSVIVVSRKIFTLLYLTLVLIIDLRIVATQQDCDMCFVKVYILVQVDHYVNYSTCLDKIKWSDFYQIIRTTRHVPKNPTIADHARLVAKSYVYDIHGMTSETSVQILRLRGFKFQNNNPSVAPSSFEDMCHPQ